MPLDSSHQRWQAARHAELAGPDSWLGLIGLFWLDEGENTVGRAPGCTVTLPSGPTQWGVLRVNGGNVAWRAASGTAARVDNGCPPVDGWQTLHTDRSGTPSSISLGSLVFFVIERDGRLAVRLRDRDWATHRPPPALRCFDHDPSWRLEARWQEISPPQQMEVPNVSGELRTVEVTHRAVFTVGDQNASLLPMSADEREIFFVFRDRSSGQQSYGGGRFLKARPAVDGKLVLDFNFAYNPPCAFTPFATCPLPPPENWLPFAVEAGEKKLV